MLSALFTDYISSVSTELVIYILQWKFSHDEPQATLRQVLLQECCHSFKAPHY